MEYLVDIERGEEYLKIGARKYTIMTEDNALPTSSIKLGLVKTFTLVFGRQLFIAEKFKDGRLRVKKVSRSLLSIL